MRTYHLRGSIGFLGLTLFLLLYNSVRTGNDFVSFTQYAGSLVVLGLIFSLSASGRRAFGSVTELVLDPFRSAGTYIGGFFTFVQLSFAKNVWTRIFPGKSLLAHWLRPLVLGLGIGIPIALVMTGLLSVGDPIFKHFLDSLKLPLVPAEWVGRIQLTVVFFLLLVPVACVKVVEIAIPPLSEWRTLHVAREITIVLGMVAVVLGTFLVVQAPYIFARVAFETDLSKFGVATYSEYVRRGFGELITVVFLVYGVLWAATTALRLKATKSECRVLLGVSTMVSILTFVFIASIARRVHLYQLYHGWSLIRLYGVWLLSWITVLFATLAGRQWVKKITLVNTEIALSFLFLIVFGSWNAEAFIVSTHPPTVNGRIDYTYLSRLSPDGIAGWEKAYGFVRQTLVDKKLEEQSEIQMEDRRDVVYSFYILARLIDQYRWLVLEYGTAEEQKQFATLVLARYQTNMSNRIGKPDDREEDEKSLVTIQKWQTDLANGTVTPGQISALFLPRYYKSTVRDGEHFFERAEGENRYEGIYVFMTEEYPKPSKENTVLDRIYRFSWSRMHAYEEVKMKMPLSEILDLYQSFFRLYQKISSQPDGKRSFQSDISFITPFAE